LSSKQVVLGDGYCVKLGEISDMTPDFSRDKLHSKIEITYVLYHSFRKYIHLLLYATDSYNYEHSVLH